MHKISYLHEKRGSKVVVEISSFSITYNLVAAQSEYLEYVEINSAVKSQQLLN